MGPARSRESAGITRGPSGRLGRPEEHWAGPAACRVGRPEEHGARPAAWVGRKNMERARPL
eukprot:11983519-Alexandrium_andersonii.AAC.1